jgi:transcriptional regulator with XRE-family HTH domain
MIFSNTLKYIRERRNIPQSKMLNSKDTSQYSRIESGKAQLKVNTLFELTQKLGVSVTEFIQLSNADSEPQQFAKELNYCIENPDKEYEKQLLLKKYYELQKIHIKRMTRENISFYFVIKAMFSPYWSEIEDFTTEDAKFAFEHLTSTDFYGQYDYFLAFNLVPYFDKGQIDTLVDRMYPLSLPERRTERTKTYSNLLITNIISYATYEMDYETALKYVHIAQDNTIIRDNYYFHLNILYHKNILLRFLKNDTKYIEKARDVIQIMFDIGDKKTGEQFLEELNNLNTQPDYYKGNRKFPIVSVHK